ncbi:MAG: hypothetical protein ACYC6A_25695 [Armatimonadota bacterium]
MPPIPLRIFRSFHAKYYEDDILTGPDAYPEEYFATLVEHGFNAVWLRGILRDLAATDVFPKLGTDIAKHQDALGTVVERARRAGAQVLLYLNEPLCLPADDPFWSAHPEVRGARGESSMDEWPDTFAFCTSAPEVRAWLRQASGNLFRALPDLGGWFLIAASEHHTHCYSHTFDYLDGGRPDCPRCAERPPADIVAELITDLRDGTRAAAPSAHCIAWNWSWSLYEEDPQPSLLAQLPKDVAVMFDWERGAHIVTPTGKPILIDEYSLSYVGPSRRFQLGLAEARRQELPVMAKLQVGTTHELATTPNLPLIDHLYEKVKTAEELGLAGMLATWNFGNAFSLNTAVVGRLARTTERLSPGYFVTELAEEYFPGADADEVASAVEQFSMAMAFFPFDISLLYFGPANYALAYPLTTMPLTGQPMGRSWVMDERGDDLSGSLQQFTLEEVVELLDVVVAEWEAGVSRYTAALNGCAHPHAREELNVARYIMHCFRSALNVYRTYRLRRDRPADLEEQFAAIVEDEVANLEAALPLLEADPRLGFHAECQAYQVTAAAVREKLEALRGAVQV